MEFTSKVLQENVTSRAFWLSKRVLVIEMRGRCAKVNNTAGPLFNRETTGKSFGEHSNLLRGTCREIPWYWQ